MILSATDHADTPDFLAKRLKISPQNVTQLINQGLIEFKNDKIFIYANPFQLDILYEDDDLLVINKAAGIAVHPGINHEEDTLIPLLIKHYPKIAEVGGPRRPGIVHRLDKGTSGVLIVAKNQLSYQRLLDTFKKHDIKRIYEAITLKKVIPPFGKINRPIAKDGLKMKISAGGKESITHYKLIKAYENFLHLRLQLLTGRTHQIRVHLRHLKIRILNDSLYGNPNQDRLITKINTNYPYPLLYAKSLELEHPISKKWLHFEIGPPTIFEFILAYENF